MRIQFWNSTDHFFIIAAPRSGTTWLSKGLNLHPDIYCTERRLFGNYADFVLDDHAKQPRLRCTLDKFVTASLLPQHFKKSDRLLKAYIEALIKEEIKVSGKRILIDKVTPYLHTSDIVLEGIRRYFPKAKLIFLIRDGRDVCTSGVFHWFNKQPASTVLSSFETERRESFTRNSVYRAERFFTDSEIEEWACTWAEPLRLISTINGERDVLLLKYEDMLVDQRVVLKQLFEFVDAKAKDEIINWCVEESSFKKMSGRESGTESATQHIRKGVAGDWHNYFTRHDGELIHKWAGDMLLKYGYANHENWFNELPEKLPT